MKLPVTFAESSTTLAPVIFDETEGQFATDVTADDQQIATTWDETAVVNVPYVPDGYFDINSYAMQLFKGDIVLETATTLVTRAFQYCNGITSMYAPEVTSVGNSSCTNMTGIKKLVLPKCKSIGNSSWSSCSALAWVDLGACTSLVNYALRNNTKLSTLIIRSTIMCALSNSALTNTAIWSGKGHVYVPAALIPSYQTATNWKTIHAASAATFRALEDYTVDGTITGELDESKI